MGWSIYPRFSSPRTHAEIKAEIARLSTFETETYTARPVKISRVGNTWYVAARYAPKYPGATLPDDRRADSFRIERDAEGAYTIALVFLTSSKDREWGYKGMDEFCGPVEATAPASILDALSKIEGDSDSIKWAQAWRERCREHIAARRKADAFKVGDSFKLPASVRFTDGHESDSFRVESYSWKGKDRRVYVSLRNGGWYRLNKATLGAAVKIN